MLQIYYRFVDATSGGRVYQSNWMSRHGIPPVPAWAVCWLFILSGKIRRSR